MKKIVSLFLLFGSLFLLAFFAPGQVSSAPLDIPVFINEIHYDNASTDSGEAIEVAGPAGTNLTGWSIVLYNGSTGAVYDTDALTGTILDLCHGYGVISLSYPQDGVQNGSPDGIALVDDTNTVIQFLSYEGSFIAVGGPADGMTSTDIGVAEDNATPAGFSLQLTGPGTIYEDFIWDGPETDSFGDCNPNQDFSGAGGNAPYVTTTAPVNTETQIPLDFTLDIAFSENVTVTDPWFDLTCSISGTHSATVTGGPADYQLNPDTDFVLYELCTLTIFKDQVLDQDDTPDPLVDDYILTFSTGQWVINEIHAQPAPAPGGDANGDGTRNATQDEFIEIINLTGGTVDISGWGIYDALPLLRHTFPTGTIVPNHCTVVLFGGGTPTGTFGNALVQTASTGQLSLNDAGDGVSLSNSLFDLALYTYGSEAGNAVSITRSPDITGSDPLIRHDLAPGSGGSPFSPGTQVDGTPLSNCALPIHDLQGSGTTSPYLNQTVTISGIVTADFQNTTTGLSGFYVQEEDAEADANPATSEGIFVYDNGFGTNVNVGDWVEVSGTVFEYTSGTSSLTEITSVTEVNILSAGNPLPLGVTVSLPAATATYLERYEGMRVTFPQPLYVTEHYELGRYGQVTLSGSNRLYQPTHLAAPGAPALAIQTANDLNQIVLDDTSTVENPDPIIHPTPGLSAANTLRGGDTTTNLTGILDNRFSAYRVQPTGTVAFTAANPRPTTPTLPGGNLKIVSANVLNYFTTLDTGTPICGPLANQDCRGANDAQEFTRQRDKILNALNELNADIIGLIEIENHATDAALDDLVSGLNALAGPGTYAKISTGPIGGDAIKVALLYKTTSIAPIGAYAVLDNTFDPAYQDDKNRPALAQTFSQTITGEIFTVVVNHLKSKGSACTGDPDTGDGQGNCNQTRTAAANVLADWLTTDPTGSGDPDFLLLGDLNAYAQEDPITTLETEGYTNLIDHFLGASAYSYVFDGQWGYLDYALANATMLTQIAGVSEWHINADEPITLDYNTEYKTPGQITSLYSSDPFRVSDHDPVVVGLYSFDFSDLIGSYGVAWHTGGGALRLGPTWNDSSAYGAGSDNSSDDGVVRTNIWVANASTTLNVTTNGAGYLAAWFDWDESGVFEADEKMIGQAIPGAGVHPINITVDPTFLPAMTIQTRFRFYAAEPTLLTPEGTEIPTGAGTGGEVEDYSWTFSPTAITLTTFTAQRGGGIAPLSLILLLGAGLILWRGSLSRRAEK